MFNQEIIKEVILDQQKIFLDTEGAIERQILHTSYFQKSLKTKEIIIITGVRRCGKSYLLRLIWQRFKQSYKLTDQQCLYLNFEDERLVGLKSQDLSKVLEIFFELAKPSKKHKIFLFFDEIQEVEHWEKFLNRLRENSKYKIFVSGSSASLLSRELATQLVGRNISVELFPFSWREYLNFKIKGFTSADLYDLEKKADIKRCFNQFLSSGGFPEVVKTGFRPLLQDYLKNIIYRDIVLRHKIKYQAGLRELVNFLVANIGVVLSIQNIAKMLKIKNLMTVRNYLSYLEESFLFYLVPMHSYSIKKQIYNPDKLYLCDVGIYQELSFKFSQNKGRILENFVFNELRKRTAKIYYYHQTSFKKEVDFLLVEKNRVKYLFQVCYNLFDSAAKEREFLGLREAMKDYSLKESYILTYNEQAEEHFKEGCIKIIPAWKWFLEEAWY